uniref:Carboxypeptidase regulatory-like domain-containing protein n=1 Tax=Schlesneria paludicola TaxID=360056 RepID=A0A7C4QMT8_9PLAN
MSGSRGFLGSRFLASVILSAATLGFAGCGGQLADAPKTVPVSGTVTVDGQPVSGANVTFIPTSPGVHGAAGSTDANGRYTLFVGNNKGAMPGSYKVTIQYYVNKKDGTPVVITPETDMETISADIKPALPPKYADPAQTVLTFEVPAKGTDAADFKLDKEAPPA